MTRWLFLLALACATPAAATRVALKTSAGTIIVSLADKAAPITTANFLRYVDQKKLDGTYFYRAARTKGWPGHGLVQGGTRKNAMRYLPPIAHEPTTRTHLHHTDGTISMARAAPGTAQGDFFITVGAIPSMDANPKGKGDNLGFAAFGHVVSGMAVVKKILAAPTTANAGTGAMRGQMITKPVAIITARRVP